jgi:DNA repair exonuclease
MRFIFTTDGHLSSKRPVARVEKTDEEYIDNQLVKRRQMFEYAKKNGIKTIIDGGDFFQYWKMENSNYLLIQVIQVLSEYEDIAYHICVGNHDLQYHSMENVQHSLIGVLWKMGLVVLHKNDTLNISGTNILISFFGYGEELVQQSIKDTAICVVHENIFQSQVPPYMNGYTAKELAEKLPDYDLYLCGHNHEQFIWSENDKIVLNGGSLMRLNTKQSDFKPAFWEIAVDEPLGKPLMKCKNISVQRHYVDILPNMISSEHLKNKSIETFVESTQEFSEGKEVFDFRKDVENELEKRETKQNVRNYVYNALEA